MKEPTSVKENIFTSVMFCAILLFVIYKSIVIDTDLPILAFLIAVPTFILSIIKLVVDVLGDINSEIAGFMKKMEDDSSIDQKIFRLIRENVRYDIYDTLDVYMYCRRGPTDEVLKQYHKAYKVLLKIKNIRKVIMYCYYSIFMIMFLLLLLHTELSKTIVKIFPGNTSNLFALWSLIVIMIEIMMKDILEEGIGFLLGKKIGVNYRNK